MRLTINDTILANDPATVHMSNVLSVQLELLQSFLPMSGWVVVDKSNATPRVFCSLGKINDVLQHTLTELLLTEWHVLDNVDELSWRISNAAEVGHLKQLGLNIPSAASLLKVNLPQGGDTLPRTVALGISLQPHPPKIGVRAGQKITLCLQSIRQALTLTTQLANAEKRVHEARHHAEMDSLTHVLNRAGWNQRLRALPHSLSEVAIVFIDVDFLKFVNDTQGHLAGDKLLKLTAKTIQSLLRRDDFVARIGGDEFVVMLQNIEPHAAHLLKERLKLALSDLGIFVSIGIAFKSETGSLAKAMKLSDARMYEEKRQKRRPQLDDDGPLTGLAN